MVNKNAVGVRIASLRKREGFSQAEFSALLNVSPQAVSKWETGVCLPDIETLLNLSWIFKTTVNNILEGDDYIGEAAGMDRGLMFLNKILICPECRKKLKLKKTCDNRFSYECENRHEFYVIDGVLDFGTREIPGEQWSLSYRNYEEYLHEHYWSRNPNYDRGLNEADIIWDKLKELRPKVILDIACGTGQGIKRQIERINWPATIIMADLSHRILKWNKVYYRSECRNPYVDMVYLACDGANLPVMSECVDVVFSNAGYESMQAKMMEGFCEAYRVVKSGGCTIYTKSVIEGYRNENSRKWMELLLSSIEESEAGMWKEQFVDVDQWVERCESTGFTKNVFSKVYGELPVPDTDVFPFENEMAQWMASYVFVSSKP